MDPREGNQMPITPRNAIDTRFGPRGTRSRSRSPAATRTKPWHFIENYPSEYQWLKVKAFNGDDFRYWTIVFPETGMYPGSWTIWWYGNYWTWLRFDKWAEWIGLDLNSDSE